MNYTVYNMNAYNLHIIKTDKFKTVTIGIAFRRKINKEEITIRNLLKEMMINATYDYPSEKDLVVATENLYDLKLSSANYRVGNYAILAFRMRFLNEIYTERGMNAESIKFLLDLILKPKLDIDIDKCKERIRKSILSLNDNKIKYAIFKLLEHIDDMPYSYNSYGYLDDIEKITYDDIKNYYNSVIKCDAADVYVVGDVDDTQIKSIFREYFRLETFHKKDVSVIVPQLNNVRKNIIFREDAKVNQTQLTILCNIRELTDYERKYVLSVYAEMLGGTSNSILFDDVREKNSYAYYINTIAKAYDNILIIYSGIENGNEDKVLKLIDKSLKNISKGNIPMEKFESAKETIASAILSSLDTPVGIINNYYAKTLVDSLLPEERIEMIKKVTKDDIIKISKKIKIHTTFLLEDSHEEDNN